MAKIMPGPLVGTISGSVGGATFSHGRYGPYIRRRAKPVTSQTEWAIAAKARMTAATQAWQALTVGEQGAWNQWAIHNPVVGSLGLPQNLTGHAAFVGIYCRRVLQGQAGSGTPPLPPAPTGLTTVSVVPDKTAGDCEITFTPTPCPAGTVLWVRGCYIDSPGTHWINNALRLCGDSGGPPPSPYDAFALIEARIGAMTIGHRLVLYVHVCGSPSGLLSAPMRCEGVIV